MGDDITIGVTEIVNNIEVTAQPNDQIVDISVIDNADDVTLNITPTVIEINVNKGSSYAKWGTILGTLSDQTDLQDALDLKADLVDGKVPSYQLPSYVDDVIEVANYAALPVVGESGKIYVTIDNNHIFRWTGSTYVEITDNTAVWGAITGTLSSQSDLQNALNTKVPYTGATGNVNLGEYGLTSGYYQFDTTPTGTPTSLGTMYWDAFYRTVSLIDGDGDTTLQIGQEQRTLIHNNTGATLTDGQVVYITGSTGELPTVALANSSNEGTSAATLGVVTETILNGAAGFITDSGIVHGLNTLSFNEGDMLWLGTTAGTFTNVKPTSPNHLVLIGYVVKKAGGNGSIKVKIQNTQELDECSDVLFSGLTNNDVLTWESATSLWKNKSIATILGYTPANDSNVVHKTGNESIAGWKTFTGGITIWDNTSSNLLDFYVNGTEIGSINVGTSYMQFSALNSGGYLFKNNAGVNSLTLTNSGVATFLNSVTATSFIKSGGTSSQFLKADGSVDSTSYQPLLTNPITGSGTTNYIPKFTGANSLGNSLIYDNGQVNIGSTSFAGDELLMVSMNGTTNTQAINVKDRNASGNGSTFMVFRKSDDTFLGNIRRSGTSDALYIGGNSFLALGHSGNTEAMRITSGGNVGIGTTSPATKFDIIDSSNTFAAKIQGSGGSNFVGIGTAGGVTNGIPSIQGFTANFASTTNLTLQPNGGNVGIGTPSPLTALTVSGNLSLFTTNQLRYYNSAKNNWTQVDSPLLSGDTEVDFRVITKSGTFYINASGNVGIGTTSPSTKLHVNGNENANWVSTISNTATGGHTIYSGYNNGSLRYGIYIDGGGGNSSSYDLLVGGSSNKLVVRGDGNVGIGTATPSAKLDVQGSASVGFFDISGNYDPQSVSDKFGIGSSSTYRWMQTFGNSPLSIQPIAGNVGIGTTSPVGKLSVIGDIIMGQYSDSITNNFDIRTNRALFTISPDGVTNANGTIISYSWASGGQGPLKFSSASGVVMTLTASSTVNITSLGTGLVYSNGGTLTSTNPSDERLKDDITDLQYGLNEILKLRPVSYNWKNDTINQGKQFGFIAQEVQEVMPELISEFTTIEDEEEVVRLGLDKEGIYATLVNAIKELKAEIDLLKQK